MIKESITSNADCDLKTSCDKKEYAFRVISGAANVIGPRICWDGNDIMRSKVNNVLKLTASFQLSFEIRANIFFEIIVYSRNFFCSAE